MSTFVDLYGERLDRELGTADRSALFTTVRRKDAINQGQLEFAKQTGCFVKWVDIPLVDATAEYDLDATSVIAGGDFLDVAPEGAEFLFTDSAARVTYVTGDDFRQRDIGWLNRFESGWRGTDAAQTATSWYVRDVDGKTYVGLYPKPAIAVGESATLKLPYLAMPPAMVGDSDKPFSVTAGGDSKVWLTPWHQALVHYAAAQLEPLRKNENGRQGQLSLFSAQVADFLSKKRPKGGREIVLARDYYRESRRRSVFGPRRDPFRYP